MATAIFKKGEKYWTHFKGRVFEATWCGDMVDFKRLRELRVFKTMEEAKNDCDL